MGEAGRLEIGMFDVGDGKAIDRGLHWRLFWVFVAADPGFEPGLRVPETRVLPLHQSAV